MITKERHHINGMRPWSHRCTRDDLWRMNFHEAFSGEGVTEQLTDTGLEAEYCLIGGGPQVEDTVVKPCVKVDLRQLLRRSR